MCGGLVKNKNSRMVSSSAVPSFADFLSCTHGAGGLSEFFRELIDVRLVKYPKNVSSLSISVRLVILEERLKIIKKFEAASKFFQEPIF
jgi:hypothetical protein